MYSQLSLDECAPDNMLVFEADGMILVRRHNYSFSVSEDRIVSTWSPFKGIRVTTSVIPTDEGHKRVHEITSDFECLAYECGYSAANRDEDKLECSGDNDSCTMENTFSYSSVRIDEVSGARVEGHKFIFASPNVNLIYRKCAVPSVRIRIPKGTSRIVSIIKAGKKETGE
jgi:hypothetical protein